MSARAREIALRPASGANGERVWQAAHAEIMRLLLDRSVARGARAAEQESR